MRWWLVVAWLWWCAGCAGIAQGVTTAVIDDSRRPVVGQCEVEGKAFLGIASYRQPAVPLKVLMVHGVGNYSRGYSDALAAGLANELGFHHRSRLSKQLQLAGPLRAVDGQQLPGPISEPLGELRITRFSDDLGQQMEVHELLWNPLSAPEKQLLIFDNSAAITRQRASLNRDFKQLINAHIADPLIYLGPTGAAIRRSVSQALCLLSDQRWEDLADEGQWQCQPQRSDYPRYPDDPLVVISHSMGSRIVVDALTEFSAAESARPVADHWRQRVVPLFMLSNQLQLLQLGRHAPEITEARDQYCGPQATAAGQRRLKRLDIVAVTDPNDLLSYPVPQPFIDQFIDSRLCPELTNVSFTVTNPVDLFGIGQFAMPMDAHKGYLDHPELIQLLAHGLVEAPGQVGLRPCHLLSLD